MKRNTMQYLLVLSQENIKLSSYEASALLDIKKHVLNKHLLIADIAVKNIKKFNRLAYTRKVFRLLLTTKTIALEKSLEDFDWAAHYQKDFSLRIHMMESIKKIIEERDYAKYIWRSLEKKKIKPTVNLDNPETLIELFVFKKIVYVGKLLYENNENFGSRKAHKKPELIPTAMHPKLARGLINILNPRDSITDPFCGAGGIMAEACLMGMKAIGYDIDHAMLRRAKINIQYHGIRTDRYILKKADATTAKNLKNIITDLPYGKSSKASEEIISLYSKFIKNITGRSVIVFPDFINYKAIIKKSLSKNLQIKKILSYYVHKTLTRKIVVIDKK